MEQMPAEEPQAPKGLAFQLGRLRRLRLLMASALALLLLPLAALFFVRSFVIEVQPEEAQAALQAQTLKGAGFGLFQRWFFVGAGVRVRLAAPGFRPEELSVQAPLEKGRYQVVLQPLPGRLVVEVEAPLPWQLSISGMEGAFTKTPIEVELPAGMVEVVLSGQRFAPVRRQVEALGRGQVQELKLTASAATAPIRFTLAPADAAVHLRGSLLADHAQLRLPVGRHALEFRHPDYEAKTVQVKVAGQEPLDLGAIVLEPALVALEITSLPSPASVFLNGDYAGTTPFSTRVKPNASYQVRVRKPGFNEKAVTLTPKPGETLSRLLELGGKTVRALISANVPAEILVEGKPVGRAPVEVQVGLGARLGATSPGYKRMEVTVPEAAEDPYAFRFELLPEADHDLASAPDIIQLQGGMAMKKFPGGKVERHLYGALEGERQPAQDIKAPPFYLATTEVTRGFYNKALGRPAPPAAEARLPVTGLSWRQAAEFANAVSKAEGLPPFYRFVEAEGVKSIEYSPGAAGYRLPTESEWLHAAKLAARAVNPGPAIAYWGEAAEIPRGQGNFAGREAKDQAGWDILPAYVDRHIGLAPVQSYRAQAGVHDLDGNAAEWLHNYAGGQPAGQPFDIFGPARGLLRLVKGGSYRTASRQELEIRHVHGALYASETIGFRLARSL